MQAEDMATASPPTLYTIGHSNVPAEKIVDLLRQFQIALLVDVRSQPYSKYSSQFNREIFAQTLREAVIDYRYMGDILGGRPNDPSVYKDDRIPEEKNNRQRALEYARMMNRAEFQQGIRELMDLVNSRRVAVMCSEENPAVCHRHLLIGCYLAEKGCGVLHIRGDGSIITESALAGEVRDPNTDQLSLF